MSEDYLVFAELFSLVSYFMERFFVFIFDEFYIFPSFFNVTYGYIFVGFIIFSLILRFLIAVPNTRGGGSRGSKRSKKGSSSSSSDSSDS